MSNSHQSLSFFASLTIFRKQNIGLIKGIFLIQLFLLLGFKMFCATTFSGTGNWSDPTRWSAGLPDAADVVYIASGSICTVDINAVCFSLVFNAATENSIVSLNTGASINVSNTISIKSPTVDGVSAVLAVNDGTIITGSLSSAFISSPKVVEVTISTGEFTSAGSFVLAGNAPLTFSDYGKLNVGGNCQIDKLNGTTGTLRLFGANQNIPKATYYQIILEGTGTKSFPSGAPVVAINDDLIINGTNLTVNALNPLSIGGDLINNGTGTTTWGNTVANQVTTIGGNMIVTNNTTFTVGNNTKTKTITVNGNMQIDAGSTFNLGAFDATHSMTLNGNLVVNGDMQLMNTPLQVCNVTFGGLADNSISGAGAICSFNKIVVAKGIGNTLEVLREITIETPTVAGNYLALTSGIFKLSSSSVLIPWFGSPEIISSNGGLWINHAGASMSCVGAAVSADPGSPTTNGLLRVSAGSFNYGSGNDLITFSAGNADLIIDGGNVTIHGGLKIWASGSFNMSSGSLTLDPQAFDNLSSASNILDLANTICSGGTITIVDPHSLPGLAYAVKLADINLTGSAIYFGNGFSNANGPDDGFEIYVSSGSFGDVYINNGTSIGTNRFVSLFIPVLPSTMNINGNLTIGNNPNDEIKLEGFKLNLKGNLVNNGVFNSTNAATESTLELSGATQQTFSGIGLFTNGTPDGLSNLIVNNTSAEGIVLGNHEIHVTGLTNFLNGIVQINNADFQLTTVSATTSAAKMFVTNGTGYLKKNFPVGSSSFIFPVGDNTSDDEYSPVSINFTANETESTVGVRCIDAKHPANVEIDNYITRYWNFSAPDLTNYTYTATFTHTASDVVGIDEETFKARHYNNTTTSWTLDMSSSIDPVTHIVTTSSRTEATGSLKGNDYSAWEEPMYYWSKASGTWNQDGVWEFTTTPVDPGVGLGIAIPTGPNYGNSKAITIRAGHTVTLDNNIYSGDQMTISAGGVLDIGQKNFTVHNGTGTDLTVDGKIVDSSGKISADGAGVTIEINGTFETGNFDGFSGGANTSITSANNPTVTLSAGSIVKYRRAAVQLLTGAHEYANLILEPTASWLSITASADVVVNENLSINEGSFSDGGHIITVKGNVNNVVNHSGTGKIRLAGGTSIHTVSGAGSLANLELDDVLGAKITNNRIFIGTLILTSGEFKTGANSLTLSGAIPLSRTAGTLSTEAGSTLIFGTNAVSATIPDDVFTATPATIPNLTVNRIGGIILGNQELFISGTTLLTIGVVTIMDADVEVTTMTGVGAASKMFVTNGAGYLKKNFAIGNTAAFTFFIGDNGGVAEYSPAVLDFSTNTVAGTVGIQCFDEKHPSNVEGDNYITRYWHFNAPALVNYDYTASFTYAAADVVGLNEAAFKSQRFENISATWNLDISSSTNSATHKLTKSAQSHVSGRLHNNDFTSWESRIYYWSKASGWWNSNGVWEYTTTPADPGLGLGTPISLFPTYDNSDGITIRNTTDVKLNASTYSADQFVIEAGGTLTLSTYDLACYNGTGTDIIINGTWSSSTGKLIPYVVDVSIELNGKYIFTSNNGFSGTVFTAVNCSKAPVITIDEASTVEYASTGFMYVTNAHEYGNLVFTNLGSNEVNGNLIVNGNMTVDTGTLYDKGFTISVKGNVNNAVTIYGGGKILLTGGTAQHLISGVGTIVNIELDDINGSLMNDSKWIKGEITLTNGTFESGAHTLTLTANTPITRTNGNMSFGAGSSLIFNTNALPFTLPDDVFSATPMTIGNLTINRAGGITFNNQDVNISGTINLTNGIVELKDGNMQIETFTGGNWTANMIVTNGAGYLQKYIDVGDPFIFQFPLGDNVGTKEYTSVWLDFSANTTASLVGVKCIDAKHPANATVGNFLTRYYEINAPALTTYTYTLTFGFTAADVVGSNIEAFNTYMYDNAALSWNTNYLSTTSGAWHQSNTLTDATGPLHNHAYTLVYEDMYYWSMKSGSWSDADMWEFSNTSIDPGVGLGTPIAVSPDYINSNGITIRNGNTVTGGSSIDQFRIASGGIYDMSTSGAYVYVYNGLGDDFTIEAGGTYLTNTSQIYAKELSVRIVNNGTFITRDTDGFSRAPGTSIYDKNWPIVINAPGSNVIYNGSADQIVTIGQPYYNLLLQPQADNINIPISIDSDYDDGILRVNGDLTMGDAAHTGIIINSTPGTQIIQVKGNVLINSNTTYKGSPTNILSIGGNMTIDGTYTHNNGPITFNGGGDQLITGMASLAFGNLTVDKTGGTLSHAVTTTFDVSQYTNTQGNYSAPGTFNINGDATLTAGNFTGGTNVKCKGNWNLKGATFDYTTNSTNSIFDGVGVQSIQGTDVAASFYNLENAKTTGTLNTGGAVVTINCNDLTNTSLTFTPPATVNVGGSFLLTSGTYNSGAALNLKKNFIKNGGIFSPGALTSLLGTTSQTIGGTSGDITFNGLTINNSMPNNAIVLGAPVTVNGELNLNNGHINTGAVNMLTLGSSANVLLTAPVSQNNSFINGPMKHTIASTIPTTKVFPVGKENLLHQMDLSITQTAVTSTEYECEYIPASAHALDWTYPGTLDLVSQQGYWTTSKGAGSDIGSGSAKLYYFAGDYVTDAPNLRVAVGSPAAWNDQGGIGNGVPAGDITSTINFTALGRFAIANSVPGTNTFTDVTATITASADVSCNGSADGEATVTGAGGTTPYSFLWSDGQTDATAIGLVADDYEVTITDSDDEIAIASVTITEPAAVVASITGTFEICFGGNTSLTASGGVSYFWNTGDNVAPITVNAGGIYTVTVTAANGCTSEKSETVTVNPLPVATVASNSPVCVGTTLTLTSGPAAMTNYSWSGPDAYSNATQSPTVSGSATDAMNGVYTITVTDGNGCTDTETTNVTVNTLPVATAASNSPVCAGTPLTLTGGPAAMVSYSWDGPDTYSNATQSPTVSGAATVAMDGTYTITITDSNGCTDTETTDVVVNPLPTATASSNSPVCVGQSLMLTGGPGVMTGYEWSGPNAYSTSTQNPVVSGAATVVMDGTYTITVTDGNGCTDTESTDVTVNTLPTATATSNSPVCVSTTLSLTGGPAAMTNYSWSGPDAYSNATQSPTVSGSASDAMNGVYTITVTDGNGCTDTETTNVTVNTLPVATAASNSPVCAGTPLTLTSGPAAMVSYSWDGPDTYSNATQSPTVSGAATVAMDGTYTITITDGNGCTDTETTDVVVNPLPTATAGSNSPVCAGQSLTLTGGPGAMTSYDWSGPNAYSTSTQNPVVSGAATVVMDGTYTITVTDGNGCTDTESTDITVNTLPTATATSNSPVCVGTTLTLTGGPAAMTNYSWSGPDAYSNATQSPTVSGSATGAMDGVYTITVTDGNGCTDTETTDVTTNVLPVATASNNSPVCVGTSLSVIGGPAAMSNYAWSGPNAYANGTQSPTVSGSATVAMDGVYTLTVTDGNGCTDTESTTATVNTLPTAAIAGAIVICNGENTTLTASGGVSYVWSSGDNSADATLAPIITTLYTVTATNGDGCTDTESVTVTVEDIPIVDASVPQNIPNGTSTSLDATVSGGSGSYSFNWMPAASLVDNTIEDPVTVILAASVIFTLKVTDDGTGCIVSDNVTINVNGAALSVIASTDVATICAGSPANLSAVGSGGSGVYSYSWTPTTGLDDPNSATPVATPAVLTTYTVEVDDGFTQQTDDITITVNPLPNVTATPSSTAICKGDPVTLTGGGASIYIWNNGANDGVPTTPLVTTTYTVTGTDGSGCTDTESTTVTVNSLPVATASGNSPVCVNETLTLTGGPGAMTTYLWSGPGAYSDNSQSPTVSASTTLAMDGLYTITVTDGNNCTDEASVDVTVNALPVATAAGNSLVCAGSTLTLTGGPGAMSGYSWTGPDTYANGTQSPTVSGAATVAMDGIYTIVVTDGNGCTDSETTDVTVNALPTAGISGTATFCFGVGTTLTASGGTSYLWNTGDNVAIISKNPVASTSYTVTTTDGNGCTDEETIAVTVNSLPIVTASGNSPVCVNGTLTLTGGPGAMTTYLWSGPGAYSDNSQSPTVSASATLAMDGLYTITVTDGNNCTDEASVDVTVNALPVATAAGNSPVCAGSTLTLTGGPRCNVRLFMDRS